MKKKIKLKADQSKGKQKKKSIPPNLHGKAPPIRKGKGTVKLSNITKEIDVDRMDTAQSSTSKRPSRIVSRRVRGPTRCLDLHRLPEGQKLPVIVDDRGQLVGENATKLQNFCGTLARDGQLLPLNIKSWRDVDDRGKDCAWQAVMDKFDISPTMRHFVLQSIGKKWRDYKSNLKRKYYDAFLDDATRYAHRPHAVLEEQWHYLVQFWNSEEGQRRSLVNKANRSHQTMSHTSGTKSFARVRQEEKAKSSTHTPPSRAHIFIKTHMRRDGSAIDAAAAKKIQQMRELLATVTEVSQNSMRQDDVFSQVMGPERHGRVRGCGLGPTPTTMWGSHSSHSGTSYKDSHEVSTLRDKVRSLEEALLQSDAERAQRDAERAQRDAERDAEMKELLSMVRNLSRQVLGQYNHPEASVDSLTSSTEGASSAHISNTDRSP